MDACLPNRLSDQCRSTDDTELAVPTKRPFSGSDKYLEEYKQRAEPLLGERLSFVFVTLCDTDLQHLSLRCVRLCVHVFLLFFFSPQYMWANMDERLKSTIISGLYQNSCACGATTASNTNFGPIGSEGSEGFWG